jgi:hypothetical protein
MSKKYASVKDRPSGPIKTYDESEILKSSNTWEFLIFEQLRALRFIQQSLFSEPRHVRFHILNLLTSMNHLESMLYDRINPNYEGNTDVWVAYQSHKPSLFKNMHKDMSKIGELINSNEMTQFQLVATIEIWFRAMDKYLNSIKRISPTVYEMAVPDVLTADLDNAIETPENPNVESPNPSFNPSYNDRGDNDDAAINI